MFLSDESPIREVAVALALCICYSMLRVRIQHLQNQLVQVILLTVREVYLLFLLSHRGFIAAQCSCYDRDKVPRTLRSTEPALHHHTRLLYVNRCRPSGQAREIMEHWRPSSQ